MDSGEAVKKAVCGCCGMREECTIGYIGWVQERYGGLWVCGPCEEAIKYEQARLGVSIEVGLRVHTTFRDTIKADPAAHISHSNVQLIRKIMSPSSSSSSTASLP
ncbi:Protein of unknown function (DUF1677) [Quillaja saponaria]|uniref:Uncharacterized protein n=1 Tax=Quillaja saponaria TaxID=32244 RepID=A0AAD7M5N8_QUISA|nr:Protein of unknown function (DUF1677) [Quillaja saponaria]